MLLFGVFWVEIIMNMFESEEDIIIYDRFFLLFIVY